MTPNQHWIASCSSLLEARCCTHPSDPAFPQSPWFATVFEQNLANLVVWQSGSRRQRSGTLEMCSPLSNGGFSSDTHEWSKYAFTWRSFGSSLPFAAPSSARLAAAERRCSQFCDAVVARCRVSHPSGVALWKTTCGAWSESDIRLAIIGRY